MLGALSVVGALLFGGQVLRVDDVVLCVQKLARCSNVVVA
jgi:hypothetical protein